MSGDLVVLSNLFLNATESELLCMVWETQHSTAPRNFSMLIIVRGKAGFIGQKGAMWGLINTDFCVNHMIMQVAFLYCSYPEPTVSAAGR